MFKVDETKCIGCEICLNVCPINAISIIDGKAQIDKEKCTNCGVCVPSCPTGAIYSDTDYNEESRQSFYQGQSQSFLPPGFGRGMGRGLGRGMGRGLGRGMGRGMGRGFGRGPLDGRGNGRDGEGREW